MLRKELMDILRGYAPEEYAESWDNSGLLVGRSSGEVKKVLIALDLTDYVTAQAVRGKYDMLITHHPLLFRAAKSVTEDTREGRRILDLIENDITYYAMHTNCDVTRMADEAAKRLGLSDTVPLEPSMRDEKEGIGRVGNLKGELTIDELAQRVKEVFGISSVGVAAVLSDEPRQQKEKKVRRIAVSPGSGHDFVENAKRLGAEVLITGDINHHVVLDANADGLAVIDAGHYGTEAFMKEQLRTYLMEEKGLLLKIDLAEEIEPLYRV